jgi:hypothetical protein
MLDAGCGIMGVGFMGTDGIEDGALGVADDLTRLKNVVESR